MLFDTAGAARETVAWIPAPSLGFEIRRGIGTHLLGATQFSEYPLWVSSADGESIIVVERSNPGAQRSGTYRVTGFDAFGRRRFSEAIPYESVPVAAATVDSLANFWAKEMVINDSTLELGFAIAMVRDSLRAPVNFPPVSDLFVAGDGRIWIGREGLLGRLHAHPIGYDVLSVEGKLLGRIRLETPTRIIAASRDAAWLLSYDEHDVPILTRHPVLRSQSF
jgi:hypothetical protein